MSDERTLLDNNTGRRDPLTMAEPRLNLGDGLSGRDNTPLYQQVYNAIRDQIEQAGEGAVGSGLPTEDQLGSHYQVSKITVRKALQLLEQDGFIARRRAKTPIVVRQTRKPSSPKAIGTIDELFKLAMETSRTIEDIDTVVDAEASSALELEPNTPVTRLNLAMIREDKIFGCASVFVSSEIGSRLEATDLSQSGNLVFRYIEEVLQRRFEFGDVTMGAIGATESQARTIGCERGFPLVAISITLRAADEAPLEFVKAFLHCEEYSINYRIGRASH